MSLLDLTETRALIPSDLGDPAFQAIIDGEEAWLTKRIGPLTGVRTESFRGVRAHQVIRLQRPTENVDDAYAATFLVEDDGVDVTDAVILLRHGWRVGRLLPAYWNASYITNAVIAVTYEPTDLLEVERVLRGLVSLEVVAAGTPAGRQSETIGSYSYTLGAGPDSPRAIRMGLLRSLREPLEAETSRVRSSVLPEPMGVSW